MPCGHRNPCHRNGQKKIKNELKFFLEVVDFLLTSLISLSLSWALPDRVNDLENTQNQ